MSFIRLCGFYNMPVYTVAGFHIPQAGAVSPPVLSEHVASLGPLCGERSGSVPAEAYEIPATGSKPHI